MATTTTIGQATNQKQIPSQILYWTLGLAVIIILGLAFSMMRERDLTTPSTEMTTPAYEQTPRPAPADRPL